MDSKMYLGYLIAIFGLLPFSYGYFTNDQLAFVIGAVIIGIGLSEVISSHIKQSDKDVE